MQQLLTWSTSPIETSSCYKLRARAVYKHKLSWAVLCSRQKAKKVLVKEWYTYLESMSLATSMNFIAKITNEKQQNYLFYCKLSYIYQVKTSIFRL